jgi:hypothetical protein
VLSIAWFLRFRERTQMSATPGASNEYSRGSQGSTGDFGASGGSPAGRFRAGSGLPPGAVGLILAGALLGALLLIVADFTTLYTVHTSSGAAAAPSVSGHSNHSYAMVPIGLLAVLLALAVRVGGGRSAILAIGVLGVAALVIALAVDLPDAHSHGLVGSAVRGYVLASDKASAGLYLETLGAVVLIATCGSGLLLAGRPADQPQ